MPDTRLTPAFAYDVTSLTTLGVSAVVDNRTVRVLCRAAHVVWASLRWACPYCARALTAARVHVPRSFPGDLEDEEDGVLLCDWEHGAARGPGVFYLPQFEAWACCDAKCSDTAGLPPVWAADATVSCDDGTSEVRACACTAPLL